ncbi:MAG: tetratricopeptide repeat protein, partial [Epsilonproteobacteria bacterium]|nr:tetratricopeptide repeat protein [Campylobacterota bacterium]
YYPDNIRLKLMLLENYNRADRVDKAFKLIRDIERSTLDREILSRVYKIEYQLLKERYFDTNSSELLDRLKDKLYRYYRFQRDDKDYLYFLGESQQLDFPKLKYLSLKGLMENEPTLLNFQLKQELYNLALSLGYRDEAMEYLIDLASYGEADIELKEGIIYSLIDKGEYDRAMEISKNLFIESRDRKYFELALYISSLKGGSDIRGLIELYISNIRLDSESIGYILSSLLKVEDIEGGAIYARRLFHSHRDILDQKSLRLMVKSLSYSGDLETALSIALYGEGKFKSQEWLDEAIKLATWQGEMDRVKALNIKGMGLYGSDRYREYLLKNLSLERDYRLIGRLYKAQLNGGNFSNISKVSEYFQYIGDVDGGLKYYRELYKRYLRGDILRELILFAYRSGSYRLGIDTFYLYRDRYGFNRELYRLSADRLIAMRRFREAFNLLKEIEGRERGFNFKLYQEIVDLATILKKYRYLYSILLKLERRGNLDIALYHKLAKLDINFNGGRGVESIYRRGFTKSKEPSYAIELLNLYINSGNLKGFQRFISSISKEERGILNRSLDYNLLLVNYYSKRGEIDRGVKLFKRILKRYRGDARAYQAYLWFMLDNRLYKPLKRSLRVLRKSRELREAVGFPAVVVALQYQKSDLALRWLKPLLERDSSNLKYKIVYSDILELQDRKRGAERVRAEVFKEFNRLLKSSPELHRDRDFISLYLRFVNIYITPQERKRYYFKKYSSLFTDREFADILIGAKSHFKSIEAVKRLRDRYGVDVDWLELYLAMGIGDSEMKRRALRGVDTLPFRDRVIATRDIGSIRDAETLAFKGMEDNSRDVDIYKIYKNLIEQEFPRGRFETKYIKLSDSLFEVESRLSYRWHLYKNIDISPFIEQYRYILSGRGDYLDLKMGLEVESRYKNLNWSFQVAKHKRGDHSFWSSILDLNYRFKATELNIEIERRAKTTQSNQLRMVGIQDSIEVDINHRFGNRVSVGLTAEGAKYSSHDGKNMGDYRSIKLYGNYILRVAYPDIKVGAYLLISRFRDVESGFNRELIEVGSSISIGEMSRDTINRGFRPFGTLSLSYNNLNRLGANFTFGISKKILGENILNISLNYSRSMDIFDQSYYGINLGYLIF